MTPQSVVLEHALSRPPSLGAGRLVCVDGPAGSGKTTLGRDIVALADVARLVHMDDLYEGWGGLATVTDQLDSLLLPLAAGRPGSYRRWDWHADAFVETVTVDPVDLLVVEGVGSGSLAHDSLITTLAWVWAPENLRFRRGIERDGEAMLPEWRRWTAGEAAHFATQRTRARADVLLDGTGQAPPVVVGSTSR